jgi:UDP-N-acetylglucosamine--N-acetylmuramyl-(pentapeptide) pyrophosphoryl-undecaprenol N-acetylglucosamine transferase
MRLRVAIACGGTGGHLFPGVAVAEELRARGHEALLLVSPKQIDAVALRGTGLTAHALPAIGWPGVSARALGFAWKLWQTWNECGRIFRDYRPTQILGMGGFTSAVPLYVGRHRRLPTFIHESNAVPGKVTRLVAKQVNRVLLGFEACAGHLSAGSCVVTGTPVRAGLQKLDRAQAAERFGLDPQASTLVVIGGSQGARGLNELLLKTVPRWSAKRGQWQFIHLTGPADADRVEAFYRREKQTAVVKPFSAEMAAIYSLADVVVGRSGAASLTELAHYGLPSVLVPFPAATDDHQTRNAEVFVRAGASYLLPEATATDETLDALITPLMENPDARNFMACAAQSLAMPRAAAQVVEELERAGRSA